MSRLPDVQWCILCQRAVRDELTEMVTLCNILTWLPINPASGYSERFDVAIRFVDVIPAGALLECRMSDQSNPDHVVCRYNLHVGPEFPSVDQLNFSVPSLSHRAVRDGVYYLFEIWDHDRRVFSQVLRACLIVDIKEQLP